jgi:hypothetical protein
MPRRQGVRRRDLPQPEPFERSVAEWQALGAPVDLYDPRAAGTAELATHGAILEPGEPGYPGPQWWYAQRWWRRRRPRFLARHGQLTPTEAAIMATRVRAQERQTRVRLGRL